MTLRFPKLASLATKRQPECLCCRGLPRTVDLCCPCWSSYTSPDVKIVKIDCKVLAGH